jgi:hypothetical protein
MRIKEFAPGRQAQPETVDRGLVTEWYKVEKRFILTTILPIRLLETGI